MKWIMYVVLVLLNILGQIDLGFAQFIFQVAFYVVLVDMCDYCFNREDEAPLIRWIKSLGR